MNRNIALAALLAVLAVPGLRAEDKPQGKWESLKVYFQHLKQGLSESSLDGMYQKRGLVAVAAVRGADQKDERTDLAKPQMKDPAREKKIKVRKAESREFEAAVELAVSEKFPEAVAALEAFEKAHPKSPMLADVRDARAKAQEAMLQGNKPPAPIEPAKGEPAKAEPVQAEAAKTAP